MSKVTYVTAERAQAWSEKMLEKTGISAEEATTVASTLVAANLRGIDTHGLIMLRHYMQRFTRITTRPISIVNETPTSVLIDGGDKMGMITGKFAMEKTIQKAEENGVGIASVRNSNHFGACAHYALMAAENNMIGISMTNAGKRLAPWGGLENILGNNPFAIAVPGKDFPIVLDMANSVVAFQKVAEYAREGKPLPEGWSMDATGKPTTDSQAALTGFLMPVGGYKGVGLTVMVDILSGALSQNGLSDSVVDVGDYDRSRKIGHFFIAIKISDFVKPEAFIDMIADFSDKFHSVPKMEGVENTYMPGEVEFYKAQMRRANGIPLTESAETQLNALAEEFGVERLV